MYVCMCVCHAHGHRGRSLIRWTHLVEWKTAKDTRKAGRIVPLDPRTSWHIRWQGWSLPEKVGRSSGRFGVGFGREDGAHAVGR